MNELVLRGSVSQLKVKGGHSMPFLKDVETPTAVIRVEGCNFFNNSLEFAIPTEMEFNLNDEFEVVLRRVVA